MKKLFVLGSLLAVSSLAQAQSLPTDAFLNLTGEVETLISIDIGTEAGAECPAGTQECTYDLGKLNEGDFDEETEEIAGSIGVLTNNGFIITAVSDNDSALENDAGDRYPYELGLGAVGSGAAESLAGGVVVESLAAGMPECSLLGEACPIPAAERDPRKPILVRHLKNAMQPAGLYSDRVTFSIEEGADTP